MWTLNRENKTIGCLDWGYSLALFLLTLLSRIPFRSQILYHWDSVNFALAIREFDISIDQPQPPGYIGYVWLSRLVDRFLGDPQTTMVWISVVTSALAVVALFHLGRSMFGRTVGLVGGLLLATSPLFWFYGEIALPHTVDAFLVILSAWLLYEVTLGHARAVLPAAVALAVAGGVRQQTPIFLVPLTLFAGVRFLQKRGGKRGLGSIGVAVILFGILCAAWFFPLTGSTGGLGTYLEILSAYSERFGTTTSLFAGGGLWGLSRNLRKVGMYTLYGWGVGLVPLALYVAFRLRHRSVRVRWERTLFLLAWVIPSFLFYALIHMGQQGLVFVFLPMLLLLSARGAAALIIDLPSARWAAVAVLLLMSANVGVFLLAPEYPLGGTRLRLLTRQALVHSDRYCQDRFTVIRDEFPPQSAALIAADWRRAAYYLPEYQVLPFDIGSKWEIDEGLPTGDTHEVAMTPAELALVLDDGEEATIVIFDPGLEPFNQSPAATRARPLAHGGELSFLVLEEGEEFLYGSRSFGVTDGSERASGRVE